MNTEMNLLIAFITGLTTGGLSCLAVQGGLLASSLAHQLEQDLVTQPGGKKRIAVPILLFLVAKVIAYTLLGFLLGALGSLLQLTPLMRALLQIAIGLFMIGNALRMFNVHPIFRYFTFAPPASLTRYLRRTAKKGTDNVTPLFLGALTVLIPCGITQAMMAVALGTGDPLTGAALLSAFTLGTTPVFFIAAYFTIKLGSALEKNFMRFVAVVLLVLGVFAIETGLNLMGSPVSATALYRSIAGSSATPQEQPTLVPADAVAPTDAAPVGAKELTINAQNNGYEPSSLHAPAETPLTLHLVTENTRSCARAFVIPALNVETVLPTTGDVTVEVPPQTQGTTLRFSCSMGMYTGEIVFDQ